MNQKLSLLIFILMLPLSTVVYAFPEMIRHGYTSCTACHVSPSGGGIVTAYGRSISKELLSRWSYEGEEQILHGLVKNENVRSWVDGSRERGLNISGDFRFLQTHVETSTYKQGRRFPMQRDLEVAAKFNNISLVTSYGLIYNPREEDKIDLRRIYGLWNASDNISLRVGRFIPIYGIIFSDHYLSIKQGLQFGQGSERNSAEANFVYEGWSGNISYSKAPRSKVFLQEEEALTVGVNWNFNETSRIGANYWIGDFLGVKRDVTGINALIGFSKKLYALSEIDFQVQKPDGSESVKGLRYFQRGGYEITRGFHLVAQAEGAQSDLDNSTTKFYSFGAGFNFYPRPHFEAQFMWTRPKYYAQDFTDSAFLILHYYL